MSKKKPNSDESNESNESKPKNDAITVTDQAATGLAQVEKHPFQSRADPPSQALVGVKVATPGSRLGKVFGQVARHQGMSEEQLFETMLRHYIERHTDLEMEFSPEPQPPGYKG